MASSKASKYQSISIEMNGRAHSADLEIRGTRFYQFFVHYKGRAESDGRRWGISAEEQHNMLEMAKLKLIQMVGNSN